METTTPDPELAPGVFRPLPHDVRDTDFASHPFLRLVVSALRYPKLVIGIPIVIALFAAAVVLLQPRTYTTTIAFAPSSNNASLSQLAGLASRFGVPIPPQSSAQSPEFYAELVRTTTFLRPIAERVYYVADAGDSTSVTLIRLFAIDEGTADEDLHELLEELRNNVLVITPNIRTSVVAISIRTEWASVSQQLGERILRDVDIFNTSTRQYLADAERQFMHARVKQTEAELREAEDRLQRFLESNRAFRQDPQLAFEHDRLQRQVAMRQQIFTTLSEALEQARIESIRNTPSISVVSPATRALRADRRHLLTKVFAASVAGFLLALAVALILDSPGAQRRERSDREELPILLGATLADLRRIFRPRQGQRKV